MSSMGVSLRCKVVLAGIATRTLRVHFDPAESSFRSQARFTRPRRIKILREAVVKALRKRYDRLLVWSIARGATVRGYWMWGQGWLVVVKQGGAPRTFGATSPRCQLGVQGLVYGVVVVRGKATCYH